MPQTSRYLLVLRDAPGLTSAVMDTRHGRHAPPGGTPPVPTPGRSASSEPPAPHALPPRLRVRDGDARVVCESPRGPVHGRVRQAGASTRRDAHALEFCQLTSIPRWSTGGVELLCPASGVAS